MSYLTAEQRMRFAAMRKAMDKFVEKIVDSTTEINNNVMAVRAWTPGKFYANDVRTDAGIPYKCVQEHDSTGNVSWNPAATPALWMQYHGTEKDYARPWVQPTGAHDMYKAGEYMIWTDGEIYLCLIDTVYSPIDYPQAWEKQ